MILMAGMLAAAAVAQPQGRGDPCAPARQLYLSPMGEPFRAPAGAAYPSAVWFAAADADRDGRLTLPEFLADADRAFARFDLDRNGEIEPAELTAYETDQAPEIRLYQGPGQRLPRVRGKAPAYGGVQGAGRYAQLNVPHPIASADLDFNRGITRDEWRQVATRRFALLGPVDGALTAAALKPTPQQETIAVCAAEAARTARRRQISPPPR